MNFSNNLLELRTRSCFTQIDVSKGTGMSLRAYQNYERGLREPKMTALVALADFYGISLDELVCRDWPKER